jgi:hypothetical protein
VLQAANRLEEITRDTVVSTVPDEDLSPDLENRECKRRGCRRLAADDSDWCARHEEDQRRYNRESAKRRYDRLASMGVCSRCGRKRYKTSEWCAVCLSKYGKVPRQDLRSDLENKRLRVEARVRGWEDSPQNEGRERLRGGPRGAPSAELQREQDVRFMMLCVQEYNDKAAFADGVTGEQRRLLDLDAMSAISRLERFCEELKERTKYEAKVQREVDRRMGVETKRAEERERALAKVAAEIAKSGR